MFTGIVKGIGTVVELERKPGLVSFDVVLQKDFGENPEIGASVAINGVCLTVTRIAEGRLSFDVMQQSLSVTNLSDLKNDDQVNVERSLTTGTEVGGHIVSGHVDGLAEVAQVETPPNNFVLTVRLPEDWMKYVFPKGFIALNGVSLTAAVVDKKNCLLTVYLIPETLRRTTFVTAKIGDRVNFEVERQTQAMVDTVRDFLGELIEKRALPTEELVKLQHIPLRLPESTEDQK